MKGYTELEVSEDFLKFINIEMSKKHLWTKVLRPNFYQLIQIDNTNSQYESSIIYEKYIIMYRKAKELSVLENLKKKGDIKITKYGQKNDVYHSSWKGGGKILCFVW